MDVEKYPERHTDVLDQASDLELRTSEGLVRIIQERCRPQQLPRPDGSYAITDCEGCGNEIGEGRLKVAIANKFCVFCAGAQERNQGRL